MKIKGFFCLLILMVIFLLTACGEYQSGNYKSFDFKLRGTWVSNDPSDYDGLIVINYSTIKITGYTSNWFYEFNNGDDDRPFKDFQKKLTIKGYSDWLEGSNKTEGKIYIEDFGEIQEGIPFKIWEVYDESTYKYEYLLRLSFGNRYEILKKVPDNYLDDDE